MFSIPFPQALVDREVTRLQRNLKSTFHSLRVGTISLNECLSHGEALLVETFERAKQGVQLHFNRFGVYPSVLSDEVVLWQVLLAASLSWQKICKDFIEGQQNGVLYMYLRPDTVAGKRWDIVDPALVVYSGFWLTQRGLLKRLTLTSQDLVYGTANRAMLESASVLDAVLVRWTTENDSRVCDECTMYSHGGDHGYYRLNDPALPDPPPVHPNCRCRLAIIFD